MAVKKAAAKRTVKKAPARKTAARKSTAKKAVKKAPARKAPARKTAAKKTAAKRTVKKAPARKAPARKTAAKRTVKKAPARKATAKKTAAKRTVKKAPARKAPNPGQEDHRQADGQEGSGPQGHQASHQAQVAPVPAPGRRDRPDIRGLRAPDVAPGPARVPRTGRGGSSRGR